VNFVDESGEIRATGFNDAIDKFYELLEVGKVGCDFSLIGLMWVTISICLNAQSRNMFCISAKSDRY
jgi:hypothetical protein